MSARSFPKTYGPWALVTGASDGIGKSMARDLARRGLNVILVARRQEELNALADDLQKKFNIEAHVLPADLGQPGEVTRALEETEEFDIGLLAACAGFGTSGNVLDIDLETELDMIDVNCRAVYHMTHVLARRLAKRRRGGIVLMSSIVAFQGVPGSANYAATKAFVQNLAEGIRPELKPLGIDVLSSAPGPVATGFAARANMKMDGAAAPDVVAKKTLDALGSNGLVRPGFLAKLLGYNLSLLPRFGRRLVMTQVMKGMTRHHNA